VPASATTPASSSGHSGRTRAKIDSETPPREAADGRDEDEEDGSDRGGSPDGDDEGPRGAGFDTAGSIPHGSALRLPELDLLL